MLVGIEVCVFVLCKVVSVMNTIPWDTRAIDELVCDTFLPGADLASPI